MGLGGEVIIFLVKNQVYGVRTADFCSHASILGDKYLHDVQNVMISSTRCDAYIITVETHFR